MPSYCTSTPPPTRGDILAATERFLSAFANNKTHPLTLLTYFSTSAPVTIQHYPSTCTHPQSSLLRGPNAIRSYFDLLATHWTRTGLRMHERTLEVDAAARRVVVQGCVTWTWKRSGRSWVEEFTCTMGFDEALKIVSFAVRTESATKTCVMQAKDVDETPTTPIPISTIAITTPPPPPPLPPLFAAQGPLCVSR